MTSLSFKQSALLYTTAFFVRALVMIFLIQPNEYYKQADSFDYHKCALGMVLGTGMHHVDTKEPVFWRTPGYPAYLAPFYHYYGITNLKFEKNSRAQRLAIWVQIAAASFIPLILFYLALLLTGISSIAMILAWISVFHPGLILTSTYLLTEGIALIFFYLFLLYLYRLIIPKTQTHRWLISIALAATSLSIYTWMRPMGEFIALFSSLFIACAAQGTWRIRIKKSTIFFILFFITLTPWYYRNYQLTGEWFFCPTIGTYLNVFSAPKILRRTLNKPILECHKLCQHNAALYIKTQQPILAQQGKYASPSLCKAVSYPIVMSNPLFFAYDWIAESIKTTLDLYSYQIIPMLDDSYWYDPIEEYLPEKISQCLYAHSMPWYFRLLCWLEFLSSLIIWVGLWSGLWIFLMRPLISSKTITPFIHAIRWLWLTTIPMIGIIIGMTGGFGYARLRLPAEPLILILTMTFWYWLIQTKNKNEL